MSMPKFILFAYDKYYPTGGWDDFAGAYDSYVKALNKGIDLIQDHRCERFHIVNLDKMKKVELNDDTLRQMG
jgi:hypothetical protein